MRGIEQNLNELHTAGIRPVAVSVDSPDITREMTQKAGLTYTFLSDPDLDAIRRYDLIHTGAGEDGRDISRPAEFLIDPAGTIRWVNLTENYWVRAQPEQIIEASKGLP